MKKMRNSSITNKIILLLLVVFLSVSILGTPSEVWAVGECSWYDYDTTYNSIYDHPYTFLYDNANPINYFETGFARNRNLNALDMADLNAGSPGGYINQPYGLRHESVVKKPCHRVVFVFPERYYVNEAVISAHDANSESGFRLKSLTNNGGSWSESNVYETPLDTGLDPDRPNIDTPVNCNDSPWVADCFVGMDLTIPINSVSNGMAMDALAVDLFSNTYNGIGQTYFKLMWLKTAPIMPPCTLSATDTSITTGESTTLFWTEPNTSSVTFSPAVTLTNGSTSLSGTATVSPTTNTTYTATFKDTNGWQEQSCNVLITVYPTASCSISPTSSSVNWGVSKTLNLSSSNATTAKMNINSGAYTSISVPPSLPSSSPYSASPTTDSTYTMQVTNTAGSTNTCSATVAVNPPTCTLSAADTTINAGTATTLTWSTTSAGTASLRNNAGTQISSALSGSISTGALAAGTYTYTLTGTGDGTCTKTVTITSYAAATCTLTPTPATINESGSSTLSLSTQNATSANLVSPATVMAVPTSSTTVSPNSNTTYTVNVAGNGAGGSCSATVTVRPTARCNLYTTDSSIKYGESTGLWWTSTNATGATLSSPTLPTPAPTPVPTSKPSSDPLVVTPIIPASGSVRTYQLNVTGAGDPSSCTTNITVNPADCTLGDVPDSSIRVDGVAGPMHFAIATAPSTYKTARISWTQATENLPRTHHFDVKFYKGVETTTFLTLSTASTVTYLDLTAAQMRTIHDELVSVSGAGPTTNVRIEVTPRIAPSGSIWYCTSYNFTAESTASSGDATISTDTQVTVKVREARNAACTTESVVTPTEALMATASGTATGSNVSIGPVWPRVSDLIITFPTGKGLRTAYTYNSTRYECATSCLSTSATTISPGFSCEFSGYANDLLTAKLFVRQRNIPSWWEAVGGLVYANENLDSRIPVVAGSPILCRPELTNSNFCLPTLIRSAGFSQSDTRSGSAMSYSYGPFLPFGWITEHIPNQYFSNVDKNRPGLVDALELSEGSLYNYFYSLVQEDEWSEYTDSTMFALPTPTGNTTYIHKENDLSFDPGAVPINVPEGESYVIFVEGNLTINNGDDLPQLTTVEPGGFLGFIVGGDITISPYVGSQIVESTEPNVNDGIGQNDIPANLTGFFVSDGKIIVQSNENNSLPDLRFIGDGSYVARVSIELQRSYSRPLDVNVLPTNDLERNSRVMSGFSPTEVFRHRPDMVLSLPAAFKPAPFTYQEVQ